MVVAIRLIPLPRWLARFNSRVTNRLLSPLAGRLPGLGVVAHTGRKTGREYRTPVLVFRRDDRFVIALTYGRDSEWVQNVVRHNGCKLETQGHTLQLSRPHVFHDESRRAVPEWHRWMLRLLNVSDFIEVAVSHQQSR